jgi:cytidine deaminase
MEDFIRELLIKEATMARKNSYCPYSGYAVGACVYTDDAKTFSGCNVENASYGLTNCAERTAIFKAVSEGAKKITAIAIVGGFKEGETLDYAFPCGACRQVLREFATDDLKIFVAKSENDYKEFTLGELYPESFGPDHLNS